MPPKRQCRSLSLRSGQTLVRPVPLRPACQRLAAGLDAISLASSLPARRRRTPSGSSGSGAGSVGTTSGGVRPSASDTQLSDSTEEAIANAAAASATARLQAELHPLPSTGRSFLVGLPRIADSSLPATPTTPAAATSAAVVGSFGYFGCGDAGSGAGLAGRESPTSWSDRAPSESSCGGGEESLDCVSRGDRDVAGGELDVDQIEQDL